MNNKLVKGLFFLAIMLSGSVIFGQTITGKVTSNDQPLPGATVVVKGTSNGTTSDFDGNYKIDNVASDATLVVSFIGYISKEVKVGGNSVINVSLVEDAQSLDEVVVIGYGSKKRSDLSTAVSAVTSEQITALPAASINEALEGRAAGVQVRSSGSPGEASAVSIRGFNSFSGTGPLYVVDGIFLSDVSTINPNDIDKVNILKDAAATAIYGSRGTNGVIIITTKRGKRGKPKTTFSTYTGTQYLPQERYYDVINSDQLIDLLITEDIRFGDGTNSPFGVNDTPNRFSQPDFNPANTNWQDLVFRNAPITNYDFSVSGATDLVNYRMGAGIFTQEGIQIETENKRYNFSLNTDYKLGSKIKVGQTLNLNYSRAVLPEQRGGEFLFQWALKQASYRPARTPEGLFTNGSRELDGIVLDALNPLLIAQIQSNERLRANIVGSVFAEIDIFDGLKNRTQVGVNFFDQVVNAKIEKYGPELVEGDGINRRKQLRKAGFRNLTTTFTNVLSYNKTFGDHNIDASFIYELTQVNINQRQIILNSLDANAIDEFGEIPILGNPEVDVELTASSLFRPNKLYSLAGRVGYSYKDKYIVSGSIRRDSDGRFGKGFRDQIFPAASAAWVVSNEDFLADSDAITNLKIRGSFGRTGNNSVNQFAPQPLINTTFGSVDGVQGISVDQIDSPFLTWETSDKMNVGLELGLFNNKFTLEADYYRNENKDLIVIPIVDTSVGLKPNFLNSGAVEVDGLELSLGYNDREGDFKWSVLANASTTNPNVTKIFQGLPRQANEGVSFGAASGNVAFTEVGQAPYSFLGYVTDGLFEDEAAAINGVGQSQAFREIGTGNTVERTGTFGNYIFTTGGVEIPSSSVTLNSESGTYAGDIRFRDLNGDGEITEADRTIIGNPNPDFVYSFNFNGNYKGFDASLFFTGVQGVDVYNHLKYLTTNYISVRNFGTDVLNRYTPTNTNTTIERYTGSDPNNNQRISDKYIEDGSYLRLKNVTLGYSLSQNALNSILKGSVSKFRLYVSAQNLLTFTKYSGYDPEIRPNYNAAGINGIGLDKGFSPSPTTFLTGLQIEF